MADLTVPLFDLREAILKAIALRFALEAVAAAPGIVPFKAKVSLLFKYEA